MLDRILMSLKYRILAWRHSLLKKKIDHNYEIISLPDSAYDITLHPIYKEADIIHLHWVAGFLDFGFFQKNKKPVIWTLHDQNPIDGVFHYSIDHDNSTNQLNNAIRKRKIDALHRCGNLTFICLGQWMAKVIGSQTNVPYRVISNGIDLEIFKPTEQAEAREKLGLPTNKRIILFVAFNLNNKRKGFKYLSDICKNLGSDFYLISVGKEGSSQDYKSFGIIRDKKTLCLLYSSADLFVIPSLQDNQPNTLTEAMACGCPVIGFKNSGIIDMITPEKNGELVEESSEQLAKAIIKLSNDKVLLRKFSTEARRTAKKYYELNSSVQKHLQLYEEVLNKNSIKDP